MPTSGLWDHRPDLSPWCARLAEKVARWEPHPSLGAEKEWIIETIENASAAKESWLVHPCLNRLTSSHVDHLLERDIRLITWAAVRSDTPLGPLIIERPSWRWTAAGAAVGIPPGRHDLNELVANDTLGGEHGIALDPYCRSLGSPLPHSWIEFADRAEDSLLAMIARETAHALTLLASKLPECAAWARAVTQVVVPLHEGVSTSASGSNPEVPGLIHIAGLSGPVLALEGLVHESAHHHFTIAETASRFVDPVHRDLYYSPLRAEPRSLRNVFLAVHALGYIVEFYRAGLNCGLLSQGWAKRRDLLMVRFKQGLSSLASGRRHATAKGDQLICALESVECKDIAFL
jgi:HEXXH motif-containing protein